MSRQPAVIITLAFIAGIIMAEFLAFSSFLSLSAASILILILFAVHLRATSLSPYTQNYKLFLITAIFVLLGAACYSQYRSDRVIDVFPFDYAETLTVTGEVEEVSLLREDRFDLTIRAAKIEKFDITEFSNNLIVRIRPRKQDQVSIIHLSLLPGDRIKITGIFRKPPGKRNPGNFDYSEYLKEKRVTGFLYVNDSSKISKIQDGGKSFFRFINSVRKEAGYAIDALHDKQTAGFLKGLLIGDRAEIDSGMKRAFMETGLTHIIAISGLHLIVIAYILFILLQRFSIGTRYFITITTLIIFMFLTGAPSPVVRAVVMAVLGILATILNRSREAINVISLTALISLIINPADLFTPGFQLSYGAVIGLVLIYPELRTKLINLAQMPYGTRTATELILASIAVQIAILPVTNYYFGIFSLASIPANIISVPLSNVLVANGFTTIGISFISSTAAGLLAEVNNLLTYILFYIVRFSAAFDYSYIATNGKDLPAAFMIAFSGILYIYFIRKSNKSTVLILLTILFISTAAAFSLKGIRSPAAGKLSVVMLDVGQGDSFLIRTPENETILIDGGKADQNFNSGEGVILPLLDRFGIKSIDYTILSHFDADHFGGLTALAAHKKIPALLYSRTDSEAAENKLIQQYFKECGTELFAVDDTVINLGSVRVYFLQKGIDDMPSQNDKSAVVKIVFGKNSFLFTGDASLRRERYLESVYGDFLDSDVLKVSHHGSRTGTGDAFLRKVTPEYALISAGKNNFYRHPSDEVLNRLEAYNVKVRRSDREGAVILISDGEKILSRDWD